MKNIYMTFDMDWASDDLLKYFYELICSLDIRGTLNVTNDSYMLDKIRAEGRLELGIHPNFNRMLCGEEKSGNVGTIVDELKKIVPEAVTARSHSLVTGSCIDKCFWDCGIKFVSNYFYCPSEDMRIRCFKDYLGLIHIPYVFADDIFMISRTKRMMDDYLDKFDVPLVFNFHPIHLFLNTEDIGRYAAAKKYYKEYLQLKAYRNTKEDGIEGYFKELVRSAHERGYVFKMLKEIKV